MILDHLVLTVSSLAVLLEVLLLATIFRAQRDLNRLKRDREDRRADREDLKEQLLQPNLEEVLVRFDEVAKKLEGVASPPVDPREPRPPFDRVFKAQVRLGTEMPVDIEERIIAPSPPTELLDPETTADLNDSAWGLIANAHGGDWSKASPEWRIAAGLWRDEWLAETRTLAEARRASEPSPETSGVEVRLNDETLERYAFLAGSANLFLRKVNAIVDIHRLDALLAFCSSKSPHERVSCALYRGHGGDHVSEHGQVRWA